MYFILTSGLYTMFVLYTTLCCLSPIAVFDKLAPHIQMNIALNILHELDRLGFASESLSPVMPDRIIDPQGWE
jgi:hypothetical protein